MVDPPSSGIQRRAVHGHEISTRRTGRPNLETRQSDGGGVIAREPSPRPETAPWRAVSRTFGHVQPVDIPGWMQGCNSRLGAAGHVRRPRSGEFRNLTLTAAQHCRRLHPGTCRSPTAQRLTPVGRGRRCRVTGPVVDELIMPTHCRLSSLSTEGSVAAAHSDLSLANLRTSERHGGIRITHPVAHHWASKLLGSCTSDLLLAPAVRQGKGNEIGRAHV